MEDIGPIANLLKDNCFTVEQKIQENRIYISLGTDEKIMKTEALKLIKELYNTDDGGVGGYGHIVFDDGNIEKVNIEWCIKEAKENKYKNNLSEETRLASIRALEFFLKLKDDEREEVYHGFWNEN
jgi:hypothetical protein